MARSALNATQITELNFRGPFTGMGDRIGDIEQAGYLYRYKWDTAPLAKSASVIHASLTLLAGAQAGVVTGLANPDVPRNLRVTITLGGGSQFDAGTKVTCYGTDINGLAISEDFAIDTLPTASIVVGLRCFATVTKIDYPARKQANDAISVGTGDKLGIPIILHNPTLIQALRGTAAPYTNVERGAAAATSAGLTDSSGGVDPATGIVATITNPDLSSWSGTAFGSQGTAINAAFTAIKAALAQVVAKLNTVLPAGALTASTVEVSKNGYTPATVPDGTQLYRIVVLDERD